MGTSVFAYTRAFTTDTNCMDLLPMPKKALVFGSSDASSSGVGVGLVIASPWLN